MHAQWIRDLLQGSRGSVRVQVSADYFVNFPVDVSSDHGPVFIAPGDLDLSPELAADLVRWQRWFEEHTDLNEEPIEQGEAEEEWDAWRDTANLLAHRLQRELGPAFEVFAPDAG